MSIKSTFVFRFQVWQNQTRSKQMKIEFVVFCFLQIFMQYTMKKRTTTVLLSACGVSIVNYSIVGESLKIFFRKNSSKTF